MSNDFENHILFIGSDENYANSITDILNYGQKSYSVNNVNNLHDFQNLVQSKSFNAIILDADIIKDNAQNEIERILGITKESPLVMIVNQEQENLGQFALEKGAFDYLVKVDGTMTSIPFTIDRALEYKPEIKDVIFDFKIESELTEQTSFFEINETGRFLTFDENLSEVLGLQKLDFYKTYLMDFIADEDRESFYEWRASSKKHKKDFLIHTEIIHREKGIIPVELKLQPYSKPESLFSGFRGYLKISSPKIKEEIEDKEVDLIPFFHEVYQLNSYLRQGFTQLFLMKLTEIPQKYFHFSYAGLYLHKILSNTFEKELSIGNEISKVGIDLQTDVFNLSEINQLFLNKEFVRFVHQSVLNEEEREKILGSSDSELFHEKIWEADQNWQIGDRLFLNLKNSGDSSNGFIILDQPENEKIPKRFVLKQAELYSVFISSLFEFYLRYKNLETKYKQFKQIFTILEAFNVELPLEGLLKEIVWTIKFSLGFNLTALAIFSRATRHLHVRAIAVEGKEKISVLSRLHFSQKEISAWLKESNRISHSYLISSNISNLQVMKRIYGLPLSAHPNSQYWKNEDVLLIPIKLDNQKIIGFFILDDPSGKIRPTLDIVQILEKIAGLVAVTIENKIIYTKLKSELTKYDPNSPPHDESSNRIKKIFQRMNFNL